MSKLMKKEKGKRKTEKVWTSLLFTFSLLLFTFSLSNDTCAVKGRDPYEEPQLGESEPGFAERFFTLKPVPPEGSKANPSIYPGGGDASGIEVGVELNARCGALESQKVKGLKG